MSPLADHIPRRALLGAAMGSAALALSSCARGRREDASGAGRLPAAVSVGLLPVVEVAPVYIGMQRGYFDSRGVRVSVRQYQGGAAVIPAAVAGEVAIGFSNVVSLLAARDRGVPLVSLAGGGTSTGRPERDINAVMVGRHSRLRSAGDLVGRTVAVNSWNNLGDTTIRSAVRRDGGDEWRVAFARIPFPEMPARLAAGDVDAVWVPEPFRSVILADHGRVLFDNLTATYPRLQTAQYFATERVVRERREVVSAFLAGLRESMAYASANPHAARAALGSFARIPPGVAETIVLPVWSAALDAGSTTAVGEAARRFGTLSGAPDVAGLLRVP